MNFEQVVLRVKTPSDRDGPGGKTLTQTLIGQHIDLRAVEKRVFDLFLNLDALPDALTPLRAA